MTPQELTALLFFKSVALRFIKGAVAGMLAALSALTVQVPSTWHSLSATLVTLAYAAIVGFFTGGFLALDKWYNWTDAPTNTP